MNDRESGEFPVFDGTEPDEPSCHGLPSMQVHDMYFDLDGRSLTQGQFKRLYPKGGREVLDLEPVRRFGFTVSTEFVGINHNSSGVGKPWIYETLVRHADGAHIVYSKWTTAYPKALAVHALVLVMVTVRAPIWHARILASRALHWWVS